MSGELALGLAAGFALGALLALGAVSLLRRSRSRRDLGADLGLPVLGRVSHEALAPSRAGAAGAALSGPALESSRELSANLRNRGWDGRTVLVTSALPEEGKSAAAVSLATAAALAGRRTLLVDCDLRRSPLADRLGAGRAPGLAQYLRGEASPQEVLQIVSLASPEPGGVVGAEGDRELICIGGGGPAVDSAELLASDRFRGFLTAVGRAYDTVLLDCGPLLTEVDTQPILQLVDTVVICVGAGSVTPEQVAAAKAMLGEGPAPPAGIVLVGDRARRR